MLSSMLSKILDKSIVSINIPYGVTTIGDNSFSYCESLTTINIPDSVTSIGYNAFHDCESLNTINIPNSVTSIDNNAFAGCGLTTINIDKEQDSISGAPWGAGSGVTINWLR